MPTASAIAAAAASAKIQAIDALQANVISIGKLIMLTVHYDIRRTFEHFYLTVFQCPSFCI